MKTFLKLAIAKCDVEYMDIRYERKTETNIRYSCYSLDGISTNYSAGGHIRAYHKGGWGNASFNQIEQIENKIIDACKAARLCAKTRGVLSREAPIIDDVKQMIVNDPTKITLDEKHALIRRYNDKILNSDEIVSSIAEYEDIKKTQYFINTEGSCIEEERIQCGVNLLAAARHGANIQDMIKSEHGRFGFNKIEHLDQDIENITRDAVNLVKAERLTGGIYTVVLDPQMSGLFIHEALGHFSEADHLFENERLKNMMTLGNVLGNEQLSVVDDATMPEKSGSYCYDDEGIPAQKKYIVRYGKLSSRLHSRETAGIMGEKPTGNARALNYSYPPMVRMSCTYIEPGDCAVQKMIEEVKDGLYVVSAIGGMTHLEMFTFTAMKAYRIKNGKIGPMVRDVVLTGNIFETIRNIDAIGDDLLMTTDSGCGKNDQQRLPVSFGGPHIRIKNVLIGGK
jgi:TldD protein